MKEFDRLAKVVARLRGKKGCPWDRAQTHASLKPYAVEETYEVLSAIDEKDNAKLKDELGDLLLQVMLHSQIASEKKHFTVKDVVNSIAEKMVRRHPHVFKGKKVKRVEDVWRNWEEIKKKEKETDSILDSVPLAMPALYRAEKVQKKAARVGFDWDNVAGAWDKVIEELGEIKELLSSKKMKKERLAEEFGDLMFAVVNVARKTETNAEDALQLSINKFKKRFNYVENKAKELKKPLKTMTLKQMDVFWEEAKKRLG